MDAVLMAILQQVAIWGVIIVMTIIIIDRLSNGYVLKYIIAKIRKNNNGVLVRVWTISGIRYRVGSIIEKTKLRYKGTDKMQRMINLSDGCVIDEAGVNTVWVFEVYDAVMNHKTRKLEFSFDIEQLKKLTEKGINSIPLDLPVQEIQENPDINDMFYEWCLMRPGKEKPRIVDLIIIGLCLVTVAFLWYHDHNTGKHEELIYNTCNMAWNNTVELLKQCGNKIPSGIIVGN